MLAFLKVLQPKTVEEAYELAIKNKKAFNIGFKICTRRVIMTISKKFLFELVM